MMEFSKKDSKFDTKSYIGNYLNSTYYNSLSYKDLLVEENWYVGTYTDSYKETSKTAVKSYVGMQNVSDIKYNVDTSVSNFLITPADNTNVYTIGRMLQPVNVTYIKNVRPTIAISKSNKFTGKGTEKEPFALEEDGE